MQTDLNDISEIRQKELKLVYGYLRINESNLLNDLIRICFKFYYIPFNPSTINEDVYNKDLKQLSESIRAALAKNFMSVAWLVFFESTVWQGRNVSW